jgi:GTP cyclohydrolase II
MNHGGEPVPAEEPDRTALRVRARVTVPLSDTGSGHATATMVTFDGLCDGLEHLAVLIGEPLPEPAPLVRLHSECLTGDVFGSARCDCGPQLNDSVRIMRQEGGVILYLRQEGRGIGLYNKLDAYSLQDSLGFDTFEANRALHFENDQRDYRCAAQMLNALGLNRIRLLSNNPDKRTQLSSHGIDVATQLRTGLFVTPQNLGYLTAKARRAGHLLDLELTDLELTNGVGNDSAP